VEDVETVISMCTLEGIYCHIFVYKIVEKGNFDFEDHFDLISFLVMGSFQSLVLIWR
jgi:hypothetical protein